MIPRQARFRHILDLGPGAGENGGKVIAIGTFDEIRRIRVIDRALSVRRTPHSDAPTRRTPGKQQIKIAGAKIHNPQKHRDQYSPEHDRGHHWISGSENPPCCMTWSTKPWPQLKKQQTNVMATWSLLPDGISLDAKITLTTSFW